MDAVGDGFAGLHDLQLLPAGYVAHLAGEEVVVPAADEVGGGGDAHLAGCGFVGDDESGFSALEVDIVRQVVDEGAEEVPLLHGVPVRHLAARDVDPHAYQAVAAVLGVFLQQAVDAHPAPAAGVLVEQAHLHAQRVHRGAVDVVLHGGEEELAVLFVDADVGLCEDVGRNVVDGHAQHVHALLRIVNLVVRQVPAIDTLFRRLQSFPQKAPPEYTGGCARHFAVVFHPYSPSIHHPLRLSSRKCENPQENLTPRLSSGRGRSLQETSGVLNETKCGQLS